MNKILIAAYNKTFRQSSDPVYAHTPMRNVGGLRTFNPKLKDSAGGEVNDMTDLGRHSPAGAQKLSSTLDTKFHKHNTSKYYPGEHPQMISFGLSSYMPMNAS